MLDVGVEEKDPSVKENTGARFCRTLRAPGEPLLARGIQKSAAERTPQSEARSALPAGRPRPRDRPPALRGAEGRARGCRRRRSLPGARSRRRTRADAATLTS